MSHSVPVFFYDKIPVGRYVKKNRNRGLAEVTSYPVRGYKQRCSGRKRSQVTHIGVYAYLVHFGVSFLAYLDFEAYWCYSRRIPVFPGVTVQTNFPSVLIPWFSFFGGLSMLIAGGEFLLSGASKMALRLGMSNLLIGLTVVAFGTSMPEMFVSLFANLEGHPDITIGNVVGSNIANIGLVLAISAIICPLNIKTATVARELSLLIFVSIMIIGISMIGQFYRFAGILLLSGLIFYTYAAYRATVRARRTNGPANPHHSPPHSYTYIITLTAGGLVSLGAGSDLFIKGAVDLARHFGIPELIIGLTLTALGTSMPELATSLSAIRRHNDEILAGNIIGSNLFNLMFVLGGSAAIKPFIFSVHYLLRDLTIMFTFTAALASIIYFAQGIGRINGLLLLSAYGVYLFFLAGLGP